MTARNLILQKLSDGAWWYGGTLERAFDTYKPSNISRRCRELENEGKIESQLVSIEGLGNKVVQYRLKIKEPIQVKLFV